jgi:hypothetical protein
VIIISSLNIILNDIPSLFANLVLNRKSPPLHNGISLPTDEEFFEKWEILKSYKEDDFVCYNEGNHILSIRKKELSCLLYIGKGIKGRLSDTVICFIYCYFIYYFIYHYQVVNHYLLRITERHPDCVFIPSLLLGDKAISRKKRTEQSDCLCDMIKNQVLFLPPLIY